MRFLAFILALVAWSASHSMENAPYSVDMGRVLNAAANALKEAFPDIASDKVLFANDVYVHCTFTRPEKHMYALDASFTPCKAQIEFDLTFANVKPLYLNREGNCVRVIPPGFVLVYVYEDGSSQVKSYRGRELQVECADEVIAQFGDEPKRVPGVGKAFSVQPRKILELALAAAIEDSPNNSPEHLDFNGMISLFCDVSAPPGDVAGQDVQIKPCIANVTFIDRSVPIKKSYIHESGRCFVRPTHESVEVNVHADESIYVKRSEGTWSAVRCNEAFYNALEPSLE